MGQKAQKDRTDDLLAAIQDTVMALAWIALLIGVLFALIFAVA